MVHVYVAHTPHTHMMLGRRRIPTARVKWLYFKQVLTTQVMLTNKSSLFITSGINYRARNFFTRTARILKKTMTIYYSAVSYHNWIIYEHLSQGAFASLQKSPMKCLDAEVYCLHRQAHVHVYKYSTSHFVSMTSVLNHTVLTWLMCLL